jgi:hypothetical protein
MQILRNMVFSSPKIHVRPGPSVVANGTLGAHRLQLNINECQAPMSLVLVSIKTRGNTETDLHQQRQMCENYLKIGIKEHSNMAIWLKSVRFTIINNLILKIKQMKQVKFL